MPSAQQPPIVELSTLLSHLSPEQIKSIKSGSPVVIDSNRNDKGQFVKGNTASIDNSGGKCQFCEHSEEIMKKTNAYLTKCRKGVDGKAVMPYIEELAMELDVIDDTVVNWANKRLENGEREHPEFFAAYSNVNMIQKLRLQQRTMGRYNPTGAIFLLKVNHGKMESSKSVLAGDKSEPLEIVITKEEVRNVE